MTPSPTNQRWQLPDGVDEVLSDTAWRVEFLRRRFLDLCRSRGFELIMPPLIEYIESLLTGTGETMDLQTVKFVDQPSGRTLGVRADITPQAARIDAHALGSGAGGEKRVNRLCYSGTVLRASTDGFGSSRNPQQFGAELFGEADVSADIEMIRLMIETASLGEIATSAMQLDLGNIALYYSLVEHADLEPALQRAVQDAVVRGSVPDLDALTRQQPAVALLAKLPSLHGDAAIIDVARAELAAAGSAVSAALDRLQQVVDAIGSSWPALSLHIDLADIRGYRYHTGLLFSVYSDEGTALAHGGRYDAVGAAFGQARPATGFSGDLKVLAELKGRTTC